jgi:hypothetical protein
MDQHALAERLSGMLRGQVIVVRLQQSVAKHRPCAL